MLPAFTFSAVRGLRDYRYEQLRITEFARVPVARRDVRPTKTKGTVFPRDVGNKLRGMLSGIEHRKMGNLH